MSIKLTQMGVEHFAKGFKKAVKDSPELMQKITKSNPELLKSNGKISTKAVQKALLSEADTFTPSGKLTKEAKKDMQEFIREAKLSNKVSPKKFFKAIIKAEQNAVKSASVSEEIIKSASKFDNLSDLKIDTFAKSASAPEEIIKSTSKADNLSDLKANFERYVSSLGGLSEKIKSNK